VSAAERRRAVVTIPTGVDNAIVRSGDRDVRLTNLRKPFWPALGITKGDLLQYYADVSDLLLPHIRDRAMVMKRYPDGAAGKFFFMKHAPTPRPGWLRTCEFRHRTGKVTEFPVIDDLPSLLWVINLGCIDLNPWYARCDDLDRPDYVHFDLDPSEGTSFDRVRETALVVRDALDAIGMKSLVKTTGSRGLHVYVPIVRGPDQDQVLTFARALAAALGPRHPTLITLQYRLATRPKDCVLVDYKQNAREQTLASVYSVRPHPKAAVSTPVTWAEVEKGIAIEQFRLDNVRQRFRKVGDLWKPLLQARGRTDLDRLLRTVRRR